MITPISKSSENYLSQQSGSSGAASAPADRSIKSHPTRRQNSLNAVGWMRSFFQGPSDGAISQALSAVAKQIEAGVSLNQALTESGLRSEIQQRLGSFRLQKILGMVKERSADILETNTLGLASQLRKDQLQVAQGILFGLQQDLHVSKETREQALAAYNANADQGPISGRLGHWMQDTVEHMSGLGMVPVIGATAFGRIFETIVLSRLGPVATGMGARLLVGAASLGLETTVAASGSYALNGGEVPLGLRGWATSLTALRLSGAAGNFLVKSMNRLGVASELQSLARTVVPHVAMYTGLYATNFAEGRSPDAIGLVGSVLSMQLAAGVGRGPLRLIEGLRGELEVRKEFSRYEEKPTARAGFASPFGRLAAASVSSGITPLSETEGVSAPADRVSGQMLAEAIGKGGGGVEVKPDLAIQPSVVGDSQLRQLSERISALERVNPEDPTIRETFLVMASRLTELGDVRGPLMALRLKGANIREIETRIINEIREKYRLMATWYNFFLEGGGFHASFKGYPSPPMTAADLGNFFGNGGHFQLTSLEVENPEWMLTASNLAQLGGLRTLTVGYSFFFKENLSSLLQAPTVGGLHALRFQACPVGVTEVQAIASSRNLENLRSLHVGYLSDEAGVLAILNSNTLTNLQLLSFNGVTQNTLQSLMLQKPKGSLPNLREYSGDLWSHADYVRQTHVDNHRANDRREDREDLGSREDDESWAD